MNIHHKQEQEEKQTKNKQRKYMIEKWRNKQGADLFILFYYLFYFIWCVETLDYIKSKTCYKCKFELWYHFCFVFALFKKIKKQKTCLVSIVVYWFLKRKEDIFVVQKRKVNT